MNGTKGPTLVPRRRSGTVCAYKGCGYRFLSRNSDVEGGLPHRRFFRFPKDKESCEMWLRNCGRKDLLVKDTILLYNNYRLCSIHFENNMYTGPDQSRLLGGAVPNHYNIPSTAGDFDEVFLVNNPSTLENESQLSEEEIIIRSETETITEPEKSIFQSVKSYLSGSYNKNRISELCRICFRAIAGPHMIKLQDNSSEMARKLTDMLTSVLPELDLGIYPRSVICMRCSNLVAFSAQLKDIYTSTGRKINEIVNNKDNYKDPNLVISVEETTEDDSPDNFPLIFKPDENNYEINDYCSTDSQPDSILRDILISSSTKTGSSANKENNDVKSKKLYSYCGSGPFVCEICGHQATSLEIIKRHLYLHKHKQLTKIICETCGRTFDYKEFQLHQRQHLTQIERKMFRCNICDRVFKVRTSLQKHVKQVHLNIIDYVQCHVCGRQLKDPMYLKEHLLTHYPAEKKHACQICGKRFRVRFKLKLHMSVHSTEKFECELCERVLKSERYLKKHMRIYHCDGWGFTCEVCKKPYWKKIDLDKHRLRQHHV